MFAVPRERVEQIVAGEGGRVLEVVDDNSALWIGFSFAITKQRPDGL